MFKIQSITINNFKNIVDTELPLGDFNIVVGPNNSGKSNFLQVIPFLRWLINGDISHVKQGFVQGLSLPVFGLIGNAKASAVPMLIKIEFVNSETNFIYSYEVQIKSFLTQEDPSAYNVLSFNIYSKLVSESFNYKSKSKTGKAINIFKRTDNKVSYGDGIRKADTLINSIDEHTSVIRLLNLIKKSDSIAEDYKMAIDAIDVALDSNIYYLSSQVLKKTVEDLGYSNRILGFDILNEIESLKKSPLYPEYQKAYKEILGIDKIDILPKLKPRPDLGYYGFIYINDSLKYLQELSDGTVILLAIITKLFSDTSGIIFIEEPENSIHPRALSKLITLIKSRTDKQFILTTHSPALLNLVKPEDVIVARVDEKGNSRLEKIKDLKELKRKLNKGYVAFGDLLIDNIDEGENGEEKEY